MFVEWTNRWRPSSGVSRRNRLQRCPRSIPAFAVLLAERPAIVGCHFGLPIPDQIAALNGAGCRLWATAALAPKGRRSWTALLPVPPWMQALSPCNAARPAAETVQAISP
jgi:hypothetical protein